MNTIIRVVVTELDMLVFDYDLMFPHITDT